VIKLLKENNIDAIAFKGPTLAQMAYGDIALRQYTDLDILIDEKDIYKATILLIDNEYKTQNSISLLKNRKFLELDNDFNIFSPNNKVHIELHWRLFRKNIGNHINFSDHYKHKLNINISNNKIHTLSLETLLVYLCIHGAKHTWERVEWINDINLLIIKNHHILNWNRIYHSADKMDSITALLLSLSIIKKLFNTNIPPYLLKEINTSSIKSLTTKSLTFMQRQQDNRESYIEQFKVVLFQSQLLKGKQKKFHYIINSYISITRNDYLHFHLPNSLHILYYIIKPFRIFSKIITKNK